MKNLRRLHRWSLGLATVLLLAGCMAGPRATFEAPRAVATASSATALGPAEASANQGGISGAEPAMLTQAQPGAATIASASPAQVTAVVTVTSATQATAPAPTLQPPTPTLTAVLASPTPTAVVPAAEPTQAPPTTAPTAVPASAPDANATPAVTVFSKDPNPLQIAVMRQQAYPGSEITFEQTLEPGANYARYVVSYRSDGYTIYALMTVPSGTKPKTGWPVILFNHGYIPPAQYRTTERYIAYVDAIARAGYIVFKADYRGHGSSQGPVSGTPGTPGMGGGYGSPGYTNDVLNALTSLKAYKDADPNRIGMWGHSMGGQVTLRAMVVSQDIKAGVIWGGVVAPYPDVFARGNSPRPGQPTPSPRSTPNPFARRGWQQELTAKYGNAAQNPEFWASISPNSFLAEISGPVQLDHSITDEEVPVAASRVLYGELQAAGKTVELYTYAGDNHNIAGNFNTAMARSIAFFDKYVKGS